MGCGNGKMVKVEPSSTQPQNPSQKDLDKTNIDIKRETTESEIDDAPSTKRALLAGSAKSSRSQDSGLGDGDNESLHSQSTTVSSRTRSGGLKRTLRALSAKSNNSIAPRQDEADIIQSLRSEGLLKSDTQTAKSGVSFNLMEGNEMPVKKMPARLAKLEKRQKGRKLLTQQDIEEKLRRAEERRKEAETERLSKIQQVTTKSDITHALDSFAESQKHKAEVTNDKVESAAEKRAKQLREMRDKLKAKEAHAAKVRQRKQSIVAASIDAGTSDKVEE